MNQHALAQFGDCAGQFDASRPGADDREGHQPLLLDGIVTVLGAFQRQQQSATNQCGVIDTFQSRGVCLPLVIAEVGVGGAGGENQPVVRQAAAVIEQHDTSVAVDAGHLAEQHTGVLLLAENAADRPSDIGRIQAGGRDLIQKWLKKMEIPAIDDGQFDSRAIERAGGSEAAEAGADDDDTGKGRHDEGVVWKQRKGNGGGV